MKKNLEYTGIGFLFLVLGSLALFVVSLVLALLGLLIVGDQNYFVCMFAGIFVALPIIGLAFGTGRLLMYLENKYDL
jgi:hypothetical protein